jgi:hypothetical protein
MNIELPKAITAYLAAEAAKDPETQSKWFTEEALVHDEGHDYFGPDEISRWKRDAQAKYDYRLEPLGASVRGNIVHLPVRLTGNFPGSPVELDYRFVLENEKIASLTID